jgi:hypothetical protein
MYTGGSDATFTIDTLANSGIPVGSFINWMQAGAGTMTFSPASGVVMRSHNGILSGGLYSVGALQQVSSNVWVLGGDISDVSATTKYGFVGSAVAASSATAQTFASQSIGTAYTNRLVCVAVGWATGSSNTITLSSATIGGVSATIATQAHGWYSSGTAIIYAVVPTGATGDIVLTFSNSVYCAISVYASQNVTLTYVDASSDNTATGGTTFSISDASYVGDVIIAAGVGLDLVAASAMTLSGTSVDDVTIGTGVSYGGAPFTLHTRSVAAGVGTTTGALIVSDGKDGVLSMIQFR